MPQDRLVLRELTKEMLDWPNLEVALSTCFILKFFCMLHLFAVFSSWKLKKISYVELRSMSREDQQIISVLISYF